MKINLHDDGRVELVEHNGVTIKGLQANNVKVGRQYEAKPLHEALASQLEYESSETVTILEPPLTKVTDTRAENLAKERARERLSDIYVRS